MAKKRTGTKVAKGSAASKSARSSKSNARAPKRYEDEESEEEPSSGGSPLQASMDDSDDDSGNGAFTDDNKGWLKIKGNKGPDGDDEEDEEEDEEVRRATGCLANFCCIAYCAMKKLCTASNFSQLTQMAPQTPHQMDEIERKAMEIDAEKELEDKEAQEEVRVKDGG